MDAGVHPYTAPQEVYGTGEVETETLSRIPGTWSGGGWGARGRCGQTKSFNFFPRSCQNERMVDRQSPADPREEYARRLDERRVSLAGEEKRHRTFGYLRLLVVLSAAVTAVAAFDWEVLSGWWLLVSAVVFFALGGVLQRIETERTKLSRADAFYERALARLDGRWAGTGETGERFVDEDHLYAQDLDIFGNASLFQLLSTALTRMGEETLAAWLSAPAPPNTVQERQGAVVEAAPSLDLREDLAVLGEGVGAGVHSKELAAWGEREPLLQPSPFRAVAFALSIAGLLAVVAAFVYLAAAAGFLDLSPAARTGLGSYFLVTALTVAGVLWHFKARTDRIIHEAEEALRDLGLLADVLRRLEAEQFVSPRLAALRAELDVEGRPPSWRISRLGRLMDLLKNRHNQMFGWLAPFLLWDLHFSYAFESWRRMSGPALRRWLNAVGEMEAISSLGAYRYEHPLYVSPEFVEESPWLEGEALAHPLLGEEGVVANDVRIGGEPRVLMVSGSNMSGKSTLLRTVGINIVLAQAGAPVRARRLRLSPLAVGASIRTMDSLQEGTSRFYAEITRLHRIMDEAAGAPPVLFLIDEFLHGTNSHDRRIGAEAIVRGLVERGAIGLVTTHDLALAHIADALAPRGANVHFEDHLEDGRMRFDYKMRPGVVERSNAIELMRSVGLDV